MNTGVAGPTKQFGVINSDRCFRLKLDAIPNHAPQEPGIYELVAFDESQNASVLYVAYSKEATIAQCLQDHLDGKRQPKAADLIAKHQNCYFDFILLPQDSAPQDWQDVLWALAQEHKPPYGNFSEIRHSGRYSGIEVVALPPNHSPCRRGH